MIKYMQVDATYLNEYMKSKNFDVPVLNLGNPHEYTIK